MESLFSRRPPAGSGGRRACGWHPRRPRIGASRAERSSINCWSSMPVRSRRAKSAIVARNVDSTSRAHWPAIVRVPARISWAAPSTSLRAAFVSRLADCPTSLTPDSIRSLAADVNPRFGYLLGHNALNRVTDVADVHDKVLERLLIVTSTPSARPGSSRFGAWKPDTESPDP